MARLGKANNPTGAGGFGDHKEHINRKGAPVNPIIKRFREALSKVETEKKKSIIEHAINIAYSEKHTDVLISLLRKLLPDLSITDSGATTLKDIMSCIDNKDKE